MCTSRLSDCSGAMRDGILDPARCRGTHGLPQDGSFTMADRSPIHFVKLSFLDIFSKFTRVVWPYESIIYIISMGSNDYQVKTE